MSIELPDLLVELILVEQCHKFREVEENLLKANSTQKYKLPVHFLLQTAIENYLLNV